MEVSTEPPRELEESSHDDLDIGRDAGKALSTEDEAGALGIFDSTWQDGSGDAVQFWHDEGVPGCLASVKDKHTPRRWQVSMPTSSWPEGTWDPHLRFS